MANQRISFSGQELSVSKITNYYIQTEKSLRFYYRKEIDHVSNESDKKSLENELEECIIELDKSTTLTILATIEAHLRIDFIHRCYNKGKEPISREFREKFVSNNKDTNVSLDYILNVWKKYSKKTVISHLIGAFKYRNWLAHGRYWVNKSGQKYDFYSLHNLSVNIQNELRIGIL